MGQAFAVRPVDSEPGRFQLFGELDLTGVGTLLSTVGDGNGESLVFDLSELTFLDSSGISAFVRIAQGRNDGGALVLERPRPEVMRVLDLVGLAAAPNLEIRTP